jgi:putative flippase GtrA
MPDTMHQRPSGLIAELGRVVRFGIAGGLNTVIGGCTIVTLEWGCGVHPLLANAGGFASGMIAGFLLSRTFVFRERTRNRWIVVRYTIAVASAFALNQVVLAILNGRLPQAPGAVFAQGAAMVSYTIACFILCRFWVFRSATLTYRQASPPARFCNALCRSRRRYRAHHN